MYHLNTKTLKLTCSILVFATALSACKDENNNPTATAQNKVTPLPYSLTEGTIAQLHASIQTGGASCEQVVRGYLDRIEAYDKQGPTLNSVITINDKAINEAKRLDTYFKTTSKLIGPMHCVTVMAKDNIDTFDMPTSAASKALMNNQPESDAYILKKIREAGGIIIGKAALDEFAFGFIGENTHPRGGLTANAYDPSKGAGGSSSGSGTAVAASFASVSIGTDTGGSIRVPAAIQGLFGLRPSLRLISQSGIIPHTISRDTAGPMCRAVEDCAILMDQMVGFDAHSHSNQRHALEVNSALIKTDTEYKAITKIPQSYTLGLKKDGLKGVRIGVVRNAFTSLEHHESPSTYVKIEQAIMQFKAAGAIIEDVKIEDIDTVTMTPEPFPVLDSGESIDRYLTSWSSDKNKHFRSFDQIALSKLARKNLIGPRHKRDLTQPQPPELDPRHYAREQVLAALDNKKSTSKGAAFDVLLYPIVDDVAADKGDSPLANNTRLSPVTGFPAMSIPIGMISTKAGSPELPIGIDLMAREFDEATLFKIAYAWQEYAHPRKAPPLLPELIKHSKIKANPMGTQKAVTVAKPKI